MSEAAVKDDGAIICPYCQDNVPSLVPLEAGMKLRLQQNAKLANLPDSVCIGCVQMLTKTASKGAVLRAEAAAKEQNRLMLWRNRVQLVRQAKTHLAQKNYSDAAIAFEKYIRVLEIIYEKKSGELTPEMFKNQARAQEMTVITSVYWDLMRIYDTHGSYADRQRKAAEKLAQFVRYSPIYGQIMRKADTQTRTAKNPEAFKKFIKLANMNRPRCFIATAAFEGQRTETVDLLCRFRDEYLKQSKSGRRLVTLYYKFSPSIAEFLDAMPYLKPAARHGLTLITRLNFVRKRLKP